MPLDTAREAYDEGYADMLDAWESIVDIAAEELADPIVAARVPLPYKWGGQGIVDPRKLCDFAQVDSWMAGSSLLGR